MRVKKFWLSKRKPLLYFLNACLLGSTATLITKANKKDILGDRTDGALLLFAKEEQKRLGKSFELARLDEEFVFNPNTKLIASLATLRKNSYLFVRGAPESVLAASKVTASEKKRVLQQFQEYASEGLRVIGTGYKKADNTDMQNLTFLGLIGISDPPREAVPAAIRAAKKAGITIMMVTGDNQRTALTIAKEIGLVDKDERVVTGDELDRLSDDALSQLLQKIHIFARTKPQDKLRLVELLKAQGYIVGVTGDGVNDALALKKADVGIAMGETGTDVAKEASDIIITDDNFATLVKAIVEGRKIYGNIINAILYLLAGNLSELALVTLALLFGLPSPLLPTQILWINLVTDGLPALALARGQTKGTLHQAPRKTTAPLLTRKRLFFIGTFGFASALVVLGLFFSLLATHQEVFARTIAFHTLVFLELVLALVVQKSIFRIDRMLLLSILLTIVLQILITVIPFLRQVFHLSLPFSS